MQHQMKLGHEWFIGIKEGKKRIESRLYDEKRRMISIGDEILFSENDRPENVIRAKVLNILRYPTFEELFASNDPTSFGAESRDELLREIKRYYSAEDERAYGVVGIEIAVIK